MSAIIEEVRLPEGAEVPRFFPPPEGFLPPPFPFSEVDQKWTSEELVYSDGEPMDSDWERLAIALLVESAHHVFRDRKSTRLNSSHITISYAVFCLKKKKKK